MRECVRMEADVLEGVIWSMNINAPLIITQSMTNSKVLVYEVLCCIIF